ncbi:MAG TPA: AAA family ATPase [Longimicrobium sp.]|nr:AAA family ATPase [Longimicrobium sp.]
MTLGFVVGKFYPPHRGHRHLIDTARRGCDRLVVLLPHHVSQKIPGELRKAWLEEIHPGAEVHLVPDELDDDAGQWARFTVAHLGRAPDVVFSSEDYGPRFSAFMGARHVMVDRDRAAFPVSGTRVRSSPLDHLEWLEPCVRAWFVRRVVLIGAESTGKTTLARMLAERYGTRWVEEYGREYWEAKMARGVPEGPYGAAGAEPSVAWTSDEFVHIAAEQQRREELLAREADRVLLCDTNAFATGTWHERYLGRRDPRVDAVGLRDRVDLYLLAEPDFPFVQDGWRDGERIRDWMHAAFVEQLAAQPAPVVRLRGPLERRVAEAAAAIDALLAKPFDL